MGQKNYKRLYYNLLRSQENDAQVQEIPITEYPQPEISCYTTPIATVVIGQTHFKIAEYHLRPYSSLSHNSSELHISDINEDIGHTFIHFLSTGCYETLKPTDLGPENCPWAREFERSVYAYHAARRYSIFGLEEHAKRYMLTFSEEVSTRQLLKTVSKVYSELPGHDSWFESFIRDKLAAAFEKDEFSFRYRVVRDGLGSDDDFNRFLMYTTLEIYADKLTSLRETAPNGHHQTNGHAEIPSEEKGPAEEKQSTTESPDDKDESSPRYSNEPLSADDTPTVVNAVNSRPQSPIPPSTAFLASPAQNGYNWASSCSDSPPREFPAFAPSPPLIRRETVDWADPDPEPEREPSFRPETEPPITDQKPDRELESEQPPKQEPEQKPELEIEQRRESVLEQEPEPVPEPKPEQKPEPKPEAQPQTQPPLQPLPPPDLKRKTEPEPVIKTEPELKSVPLPKPAPGNQAAPAEQPAQPKKKNKPNSHRRKKKNAQMHAAAAQQAGPQANGSAAKP
ncbi:hypothetical protein AtubIFM56815_005583 [Aspergillus tubingensis]|uniref:BTB domain-containing protein n=1 Tax=Aspergillus tubingensis TaxID=5068 RepID=A0A9W6AZQ5_ASPTU|nr:hypothetical protein AtubIFM56815_005583 [Aspergillus tubingensis]GLA95525.1 hypothetical protein AtubIFM57143_002539 [Aspergillus tubingensis]